MKGREWNGGRFHNTFPLDLSHCHINNFTYFSWQNAFLILLIVCKIVAIELQGAMEDTGKSREILRLGHDFDKEHKKIPYKFS